MVEQTKTGATTRDLRRIKKCIDTELDGFVTNYGLRSMLGLHKYRIDDALDFLTDMGLIGVVVKDTVKCYFSKSRENPNGIKSKKIGKRTQKQLEEDIELIAKIENSGFVTADKIISETTSKSEADETLRGVNV